MPNYITPRNGWCNGMEEVSLWVMTRELCHELYRNWEQDPDIYMDMELFAPYVYSADKVDQYFDKKQQDLRIFCRYEGRRAGGRAPAEENRP